MRILMIFVLVVSGTVFGGEFKSYDAKKAKAKYEKALEKAQKVYISELKKAKSKAMRAEKLDEAMKITNVLATLEGDKESRFKDVVGSWMLDSGDIIMKIKDDGTFTTSAKNKAFSGGTLKIDDKKVSIIWSGGKESLYTLKGDMLIQPDGRTWKRK